MPESLFTYQLVDEGDGAVRIAVDATLAATAFVWDFGDGEAPVTSQSKAVTHTFTCNATYQVKLTAKRQEDQLTSPKAGAVAIRLARTFDDF